MILKLPALMLLLASTLTVMAGATMSPALPGMEQAFHHLANAEMLVKLVISLPGLMVVFTAPLVGLLLDRWQKKSVLIMATLVYGIAGTSGYFLQDSLAWILFGRIFLGIAVAGIMVTCTTLIGDYFKGPEQGKYIGLQAAFGGFGGVFFLALGGFLADLGWGVPFLIYSLAFLILPGLVLLLDEPDTRSIIREDPPGPADLQVRLLLTSCYLMAAMEMVVMYMVPMHFPFYIKQLGPVSATQTGIYIAAMLLMMAYVSSYYRVFRVYVGFALLQTMGLVLLALGYLSLALSQSETVAVLGLCLSGLGLGLMRPNLVAWLMSSTSPQYRGRVMGGLTSFVFIGQFMSVILTQPLVDSFGYSYAFFWAGCVMFVLALVYFLAWLFILNSNRHKHNVVTES
ncbi:MAG: MFS transporter [Gammaproteobacteria bacterium]